ncbi:S8 family peptidase [Dehalobacterium formicoaceticum]|uniref:S8 family peptidase n=1 Tax=Dehalobacterium formicoaceticum TaxID=51515 RepID=UPI0031F6C6A9
MRKFVNYTLVCTLFLMLCLIVLPGTSKVWAEGETSLLEQKTPDQMLKEMTTGLDPKLREDYLPEEAWTDRMLVQYAAGKKETGRKEIITALKGSFKEFDTISLDGWDLIHLTAKQNPLKVIKELEGKEGIIHIQPDELLYLAGADPNLKQQWSLGLDVTLERASLNQDQGSSQVIEEKEELSQRVGADFITAWEKYQGKDILIALIDTGVDVTHPDLAQNIWSNLGEIAGNGIDDDHNGYIDDLQGWDFVEVNHDTNIKEAEEWHGTALAGVISAVKDNDLGIVGGAPRAKILPLRVFKNDSAYTSDVIEAIFYAESMGVQIINCSWGSSRENKALREAMEQSTCFFTAAAGNNGWSIDHQPIYPASFDLAQMITVTAINREGFLSSFANYGKSSVDTAAPGEDILSTAPGGKYESRQGTSFSAALAAAAAALLLEQNPDMQPGEIKKALMETGDLLSTLTEGTQNGRKLNAGNALEKIMPDKMTDIEGSVLPIDRDIQVTESMGMATLRSRCRLKKT